MPHVIVEYSDNVGDVVDIGTVLDALHQAALETGVFPVGGLRTRAARHETYIIADRHPDNMFVHVEMRIGAGRTDEVRQKAAELVFAALQMAFIDIPGDAPLGLSLEVVEIDPVGSLKANGIHSAVERRRAGTTG